MFFNSNIPVECIGEEMAKNYHAKLYKSKTYTTTEKKVSLFKVDAVYIITRLANKNS